LGDFYGVLTMQVLLEIASSLVSIAMVFLILLQVKGGALGTMLGGEAGGGIARTRRGLEKTIFQVTIILSIAFLGISLFSVVARG
jgi:preprotein translocase subunit SecG